MLRFILGEPTSQIQCIRVLLLEARARGLKCTIVSAASEGLHCNPYRSALEVQPGDVWIECASDVCTRTTNNRDEIDAAKAKRIGWRLEWESGDKPAGRDAFLASSLGQVYNFLLGLDESVLGQDLADLQLPGLHPVIDPYVASFPAGWSVQAQPYGLGFGRTDQKGQFQWIKVLHWAIVVGEEAQDPDGFIRGACLTSRSQAESFLLSEAARRSGMDRQDLEEALDQIRRAPGLEGFPLVADLRGLPDLMPVARADGGHEIPGSAGRLGVAVKRVPSAVLPTDQALLGYGSATNGEQRDVVLFGNTRLVRGQEAAILTSVGADPAYIYVRDEWGRSGSRYPVKPQ